MRSLVPVVSFLLAAGHAQTPEPQKATPSPQAAPAPAAKSGDTYRSDIMHLTVTYPAGMMDGTPMMAPFLEQEKKSTDPDIQRAVKCTTIPLALMDMSSGTMMMLMQVDAECQHVGFDAASLGGLAKGMLGSAAAMPGFKLSDPTSYEVAGHPAVLVGGAVNLPNGGPSMQFTMACVAAKPSLACFQLIAMTPDGLSSLSNLTLTFDGSPAAALLPADATKK